MTHQERIQELQIEVKALLQSWKHWVRLANRKLRAQPGCESPTSVYCALCRVYSADFWAACDLCPIRRQTRASQCRKTPFYDARAIWTAVEYGERLPASWNKKAGAMARFLEKLLKKRQALLEKYLAKTNAS